MNLNKIKSFGPGQEFRLDRKILFVEYESMTGELVKCRFDFSMKTELILDGYRILSFEDLSKRYSKGEALFIKKVEYYEQECHMVVGNKLLILKKVYFESAGYQSAYETHDKFLRNIENSAYGFKRDSVDVLADSARYIYMHPSRGSGKIMWLSNIASNTPIDSPSWLKGESVEEAARNDAIEKWLKAQPKTPLPISPVGGKLYIKDLTTGEMKEYGGINEITAIQQQDGYFDTDMAMTREEMYYCLNDVAITEKLYKEEKVMRFDMYKPTIKNIIFNNPATIVMWSDGTKTVVKCGEDDTFDPEKGVAMCCMKKLLGTNKTGSNYLDKVDKYFDEYDEEHTDIYKVDNYFDEYDEEHADIYKVDNYFDEYDEEHADICKTFKTIGEILSDCFRSKNNENPCTDIPPEVTIEKEFEAVTSDEWKVSEENE